MEDIRLRSGVALQIQEQDDSDSLQVLPLSCGITGVGQVKVPTHELSFLNVSIFAEPHWQIADPVNAGSAKSTPVILA